MTLATNLENLDGLDEALRPHYVQAKNGKWIPDVEGLGDRIAALNSESRQHRERAEAAEKKLTAFKDIDPERVAGLAEELRLSRQSEREAIVRASLPVALAKARCTIEGLELLTDKLGSRITIETKDGRRKIRILAADGKTIMEGATIASLVAEARETWGGCFEASGGFGSNAPTG